MPKDIIEEYVKILNAYMSKFGLYSIDITRLLNSTKDILTELGNAKNGPTLRKLEAISNLFGLKHYQFDDPNFPLPDYDSLPERTKEKIKWRKEIGPPDKTEYNKIDLKQITFDELTKFADVEKFLPSDLFNGLSEELREKLGSASRITGLFSDELKSNVQKTGKTTDKKGKGRKEEYYKVISLEMSNKESK